MLRINLGKNYSIKRALLNVFKSLKKDCIYLGNQEGVVKIKVKKIIGKLFYKTFKYFPASNSLISFKSKQLRYFAAKLILDDLGENVNVEKGAVYSSKVTIKNNSGIGVNARLFGEVHIGKDVMMGPNCVIHTQNHNFSSTKIPMNKQGYQIPKPVVIEDDVWLGSNVIILPGSKIKKGSIIGAGSVVRGEVPEYAIVIGNPGKVVKYRN